MQCIPGGREMRWGCDRGWRRRWLRLCLSPLPRRRHRAGRALLGTTRRRAPRGSARNGTVKSGVDVLEAHNFDVLAMPDRKKRIGLVTNQTGIDAQGRRTIDVLAQAPGVSLEAIFSPEHGVTGTLDTTDVNNSKDATTGVPVYSVYGAKDAARRPPDDVMKRLDAVVFDIQDAGARFYTYETTLGYFLEAAAAASVEVIVLDRPDPVTGSFVQGP